MVSFWKIELGTCRYLKSVFFWMMCRLSLTCLSGGMSKMTACSGSLIPKGFYAMHSGYKLASKLAKVGNLGSSPHSDF